MIFLGHSHSFFIVLQKFGAPSAILPLNEEQAIPQQSIGQDLWGLQDGHLGKLFKPKQRNFLSGFAGLFRITLHLIPPGNNLIQGNITGELLVLLLEAGHQTARI